MTSLPILQTPLGKYDRDNPRSVTTFDFSGTI